MQNFHFNKILVPIDFCDTSLNALDTAIAIAKRQKSRLFLLHVFSKTLDIAYPEGIVGVDFTYHDVRDTNKEKIRLLAEEITNKHGVECQDLFVSGAVCPMIVEKARQTHSNLIVMGTHGASGLREFFIGSNAYAVLKHAPCPVLTVPPHHKWENFRKILFPVRPIANALEKYEVARSIIRKNDAELIVMGLLEIDSPYTFDSLNEEASKLIKVLEDDKVKIDPKFYHCDSFAQKILDKAQALKVDLIIITATLDYKIQDFFIGPFVQQVVNHAHMPVLSIRPAPYPLS